MPKLILGKFDYFAPGAVAHRKACVARVPKRGPGVIVSSQLVEILDIKLDSRYWTYNFMLDSWFTTPVEFREELKRLKKYSVDTERIIQDAVGWHRRWYEAA